MKKYLLLFLVVMLFVLTITGCASKKTITLEDKELGLKTTFTYNDKVIGTVDVVKGIAILESVFETSHNQIRR